MKLIQRFTFFVAPLVGVLFLSSPAQSSPQADDVAVGVGFVFGPYNLAPAEQETILGQMQQAGVRVVRCSMSDDASLPEEPAENPAGLRNGESAAQIVRAPSLIKTRSRSFAR
jgi:hypothetical protein